MKNTGTAYLLWLTCFLGFCGVHRFYSGRYASGLIWLFTLGVFGFGQVLDLALIPGMVEDRNLKHKMLHGNNYQNQVTSQVIVNVGEVSPPTANPPKNNTEKSDVQVILQLAKDGAGSVSIADCVIATGKTIAEIKQTLGMLCEQELMAIDNHSETGAVIYRII